MEFLILIFYDLNSIEDYNYISTKTQIKRIDFEITKVEKLFLESYSLNLLLDF